MFIIVCAVHMTHGTCTMSEHWYVDLCFNLENYQHFRILLGEESLRISMVCISRLMSTTINDPLSVTGGRSKQVNVYNDQRPPKYDRRA